MLYSMLVVSPVFFVRTFVSNVQFPLLVHSLIHSLFFSLDDLIQTLLRDFFIGFPQLYLMHIGLTYGWMNMWAELLGFADQGFYQVNHHWCARTHREK